jgi:hypothetical protein
VRLLERRGRCGGRGGRSRRFSVQQPEEAEQRESAAEQHGHAGLTATPPEKGQGRLVVTWCWASRRGTWVARGRDEDAGKFAARVSQLGFPPAHERTKALYSNLRLHVTFIMCIDATHWFSGPSRKIF